MRALSLLLLATSLSAGAPALGSAQSAGPLRRPTVAPWEPERTSLYASPPALPARASVPADTARSRFSGAWRGALIGFGAGAVLGGYGGYRLGQEFGTDSGDKWEGAAIGAGVLGALGALVGFAIDSDH